MHKFLLCYLLLSSFFLFAQEPSKLQSLLIPENLTANANSVVRLDKKIITIPNQKTIEVTSTRVITILNKNGNKHIDAFVHYDEVTKVKSIKASVYNRLGKEIKSYKKRDFKDVSAVDGISLFTDSRVMYLEHTPISYPYTVVFETVTISKNTAWIPDFFAATNYYSSIEESYMEITYEPSLELRHKESDVSDQIEVQMDDSKIVITSNNVEAIVPEAYSPGFSKIVSKVQLALNHFHLEGVNGNATSWKMFGEWMDEYLLNDAQELPESTVQEIEILTQDTNDVIEKARRVYEYVQKKTRYISVQVGIGGWKPMLASEVDNLGYGDCKALSNYTKSLLEVAGIPSYYTILYGDRNKRDIEKDFPSIQGNHAILAVPVEEDYVWLECTDQTVPFGFIANFTDDRDVLVVTPEGGKIVRTKNYQYLDNSQKLVGSYVILEDGSLDAEVTMVSKGTQYNDRYDLTQNTEDNKKKHYYNFWEYINNLKLKDLELVNNKNEVVFIENVVFTSENYGSFAGDEMLFTINALNRYTHVPKRIKNRLQDIEIDRGFSDSDEVTVNLPKGYEPGVLPDPISIETDFGNYKTSIERAPNNQLLYKRTFDFLEGVYSKDRYNDFRNFLKSVVRQDAQKIVLKKID